MAQRRYQRWRAEPPFRDESLFRRFLASIGLEEGEFRDLLGESPDDLQEPCRVRPSWMEEIAAALAGGEPFPPLPEFPKVPDFVRVVEPLVLRGLERLRNGARQMGEARGDLPFDPDTVVGDLLRYLYGRLVTMLTRTLVLELHVAARQELLSGETPEERFQSFAERLKRKEISSAFLEEYPILTRMVTQMIADWGDFGLDFLRHLSADWDVLREAFGSGNGPGTLAAVTGSLGDSHRGGRSVLILRFSSGLKLTYKPKPLAVELRFQELLAWLNARGASPPFRVLQILDRGTYGWTEFVPARECASPEEVERFYTRQGGYLALFYLLEATDLHHENLIADGEHPVMIDLEALFHPPRIGQPARTGQELPADELIHESVLRVGLLPQRIWSNGLNEGVDLSGLAAARIQKTPLPVLQIEGQGTDRMQFVRERADFQAADNHPSLNGEDVDLLDYADAIADGFSSTYHLLLEHREALVAEGGPVAAFSDAPVRIIARPTRIYSTLLSESLHPYVLRDALDRDRLLRKIWVGIDERPQLAELVPAEIQDLERGDVPIFTTHPGSCDLWTSSGERFAGFLEESGLERARKRFSQADERDLDRQLTIVRGSLTALALGRMPPLPAPSRPDEALQPVQRERLLAGACTVGDRLERLAVRAGTTASWFGYNSIAESGFWSYEPVGHDLYAGLCGIALFLGHLGAVSGEERYTGLGRAAFETVRSRLRTTPSVLPSVGALGGWGGWIYTLTRLGLLWEDPSLLAEADRAAAELGERIERDETLDVIGGSAGGILALLRLHRLQPSAQALAAAVQCGNRLASQARPMERGLGWTLEKAGSRPLAGLSHGAAGISWSLLELADASGEERFRSLAMAGIEYERSLFSPEEANWPDLRQQKGDAEGARRFECAWCHGASGIGFARLASLPYLEDPEARREIAVAIDTTLARGFGKSHCLCHGDLGNLDFLLTASRALEDRDLGARVDRLAAGIFEDIEARTWRCGTPGGVETPGLLMGIAGIGYELLRLAEPARVPSVLILECR